MACDPECFTNAQLLKAIERLQRRTFYGELTIKSIAGKITDLKITETKKPDSPDLG